MLDRREFLYGYARAITVRFAPSMVVWMWTQVGKFCNSDELIASFFGCLSGMAFVLADGCCPGWTEDVVFLARDCIQGTAF